MDRKQFFKTAAVAAAGLGLAACKSGKTEKNASALGEGGEMATNYPGIGLLGYGCMRWPLKDDGNGGKVIDQDQVNRLVDEAIRSGVNYFDSAPIYLGGNCEEATSIALNRHPRDKWLLATKLSNFNAWDYESSLKMYRHSLEVFRTDHIDYYLLHALSGGEDFEKRFGSTGIMDFLLAEREAGHIRNLGFSFHGDQSGFDEMMALHDRYHWDFVQIQLNYYDWYFGTAKEQYEILTAAGIPVMVMEPVHGGMLAKLNDETAAMLKTAAPERTLASWAMRWVLGLKNVQVVLSGMSDLDQLTDNVNTFSENRPLTEKEQQLVERMVNIFRNDVSVPCTACRYCCPNCPAGLDIPKLMSAYNEARIGGAWRLASLKALPEDRRPAACIVCGSCNRHCPQQIDVPKYMHEMADMM